MFHRDLAPLRWIERREMHIAGDARMNTGEMNSRGIRQGLPENLGAADDHDLLRRLRSSNRRIERRHDDAPVDVQPGLARHEGVRFVAANRISARDVMDVTRVIATREALERLQDALG